MAVLGCPGFPWGRELSATGWQMLFPCWGGLRMEMVYRGTEQASWFSPCVYPFISNGPSSFWGRTTTEYLAGAASHGNQSTMDTSPSGAGSSENWSTVDFSADCYAAGPRSLCKVGATADNQHPTGPLPRELVYCGHMSGWGLSLREPVYCGQWGWQDSGWVSLTFQGGATSKGQRAAGASSHDWLILYLRIPEKHGLSSWSPMGTGLPRTWVWLGTGPWGIGLPPTPGLACFWLGLTPLPGEELPWKASIWLGLVPMATSLLRHRFV